MRMPEVMLFLTLALRRAAKKKLARGETAPALAAFGFTGVAGQPLIVGEEGGLS